MAASTATTPLIRDLFGGTMKAVIPAEAKDVSEIREIPDNQEVFCHPATDQSIMVDILEYQNHVQGEHAARYHFDDIASSNESLDNYEVVKIERIPTEKLSLKQVKNPKTNVHRVDPSLSTQLQGALMLGFSEEDSLFLNLRKGVVLLQAFVLYLLYPPKNKNKAKNVVEISLALFRLPQFSTDIVVTLNNPTYISQSSSSSKLTANVSSTANGSADSSSTWTEETFYFCVTSLSLVNPELLFGENT